MTRVGILGVGYIAKFHAGALEAVSDAQLVAVCDQNLALAQRFAAGRSGVTAYGSLQEMLQAGGLDAVHVLLPPDRHFEACRQLLEQGIHVLCEKPLATTEAECQTLGEVAAQRGAKLATSHNFLFASVYEDLREAVKSGRLGHIDHIEVVWSKYLRQPRSGPFSAWMLREPQNIMLEVGPHSFAHLLDLAGDVSALSVRVGRPLEMPHGRRFFQSWDIQAECGATQAQVRFSLISGYPEQKIHVRGSLASASVDLDRNIFQLHRHRPLGLDFDRFAATVSEAADAVKQGGETLLSVFLTKAKLQVAGTPFEASIRRSVQAFYANLGGTLDERHSPGFSTRVVALGERIGREAGIAPNVVTPARVPHATRPVDVLVTGASGFIGREVVRQLVQQGRGVRVITRSASSLPPALEALDIDVCVGQLDDEAFIASSMQGVRHVIHLARSQGTTWEEYKNGDVENTRRLARAALAAKVERFVYASSIVVYYVGAAVRTITEDTPPDPAVTGSQTYARAKAYSEQMLKDMHLKEGLPLVIVRPGIVVGSGASPLHGGVGVWSHPSICALPGDGLNQLPLVLVSDVADAFVRCLTTAGIEGESFNLVGDATLSAQEYLDELERAAKIRIERRTGMAPIFFATDFAKWMVKRVARYPDPTRPSYRAAESRRYIASFDCSRAKRLLGWQPTADRVVLIEEGIRTPVQEFMT